MQHAAEEKRASVLDPIERVSEVIFGLLMAMTFIGSLSVATAGREEIRTMMITALGCNLAWGLADAVMYLVRTVTDRTRNRTLLARLRGGADAATGQALVAGALQPGIAAMARSASFSSSSRQLFRSSCRLCCSTRLRSRCECPTPWRSECCSSPAGFSRATRAETAGALAWRWRR